MPIGDAVKDYLLFPWLWNMFMWYAQFGMLLGCSNIGVWGLFFYNDNGEMMQACFETGMAGGYVEYIKA